AAGDHEGPCDMGGGHSDAEGVKARRCRWANGRADIAARHWIVITPNDAPSFESADIAAIEGAKALIAEGCRRTQFAGAERGRLQAKFDKMALDARKTFFQGHRFEEADTFDLVAAERLDPSRILERSWNIAIAERRKCDGLGHLKAPRACARTGRICGSARDR